MAPTSPGSTSPLPTASSPTSRTQVRFLLSLHSWLLAKATIRRSLKGPTSGGQRLYLQIYGVGGRMKPCLASTVHVGWAIRSEDWSNFLLQPESLRHLRKPFPRIIPTIRPPPKPPHPDVYTFLGFPTLLPMLRVVDLVLARVYLNLVKEIKAGVEENWGVFFPFD
ncbi:hypothetical protein V6N13_036684 [Hibiscus sabdariffa]|uniref:Uncharacterized protein n=1 Tax=Hibiscus sabdariffa TaxID=183260 RepID=A0ABR2S664_9ROSI